MTVNPAYESQQSPLGKDRLSAALISPDERRRKALFAAFEHQRVTITAELVAYPNFDQLTKLIESDCDVVLVDLDEDPDVALDLVENICSRDNAITVMVCSRKQDPNLLVQCMRAGAREFLSEPISHEALAEAVVRASARLLEVKRQKKLSGKIFTFCGAKGGAGVTTLAANFAIALKQESLREVALVDLKPQLGDVAVILGLSPLFTTLDALNNAHRLDDDFVSTLLVEHSSGVSVLASPDRCGLSAGVVNGNVRKLLYVLREKFPYVVVDAGAGLDAATEMVCEMADTVYLVAHAEIPALRNAERLLSRLSRPGSREHQAELVLNRYDPRKIEIGEAQMAKVLPQPPRWKVPNDYVNVSRSLNAGVPLVSEHLGISKVVREMARTACGKPVAAARKKKWSLFD